MLYTSLVYLNRKPFCQTDSYYMKNKFLLFFFLLCTIYGSAQETAQKTKISDDLEIVQLSPNVYMPVSYLHSESFGRVPCNGLIYIDNDEAVFMDTPPNDALSKELLDWFNKTYPTCTIKGIIVNHFHDDCLGGLHEFHRRGITSYSSSITPTLIKADSVARPIQTFSKRLIIPVGKQKVVCLYPGEAHTKDNIVSYIISEKILFGGCMVKAIDAAKGNVADANEKEWSHTIETVKKQFSKSKLVIPGHGDYGGPELLDYTIKLFSADSTKQN